MAKTKKENISSKVSSIPLKARVTTPHYVKKAKSFVFTHFSPAGKPTQYWDTEEEGINKKYKEVLATI